MNYEELVKDLVVGKKCEKMVLLGSRCKEILVFAKIQFKVKGEKLRCHVNFFDVHPVVYDDDSFFGECKIFVSSLGGDSELAAELCAKYNCEQENLALAMSKDLSGNVSKFTSNLLSVKPISVGNDYWFFQVGKDVPFWAVDHCVSSTLQEQMKKLCEYRDKALSESEADTVIGLVDSLDSFCKEEEKWLLRFLSLGGVDRDVAMVRCDGSELIYFECCHVEECNGSVQEIPDDTKLRAYVDGYSKYVEEPGSVVAIISLTKHGDVSIVWNLPEYSRVESVQNLVKSVIEELKA